MHPVSRVAMAAALTLSAASMLAHNQYELPLSPIDPQNAGPIAFAAILGAAYAVRPGSKVTPRIEIPLQANEFKQLSVLKELGIGNIYNARLSVKVIAGEGKVTAYGSVLDMKTNDSTYVPAQ